jgi:hypothetical protein
MDGDDDVEWDDGCPECGGDGLVVVGWDDDSYENIEGPCHCEAGDGYRKLERGQQWTRR